MSLVIRSMALLADSAREQRHDAVGRGGDRLKQLAQRRDANRADIVDRGDRAAELGQELDEVNDRHILQKGVDWVFGQDPAGDINERQLENQAGIEKAQSEIEVVRSEQKSILKEIERADQGVGQTDRETKQMLEKRERTLRDGDL